MLTDPEIQSIIGSFEHGTLPKEDWHHREHLIVAYWYLEKFPKDEATFKIKIGINNYNRLNGIQQTPSGGYHETLTVFFI